MLVFAALLHALVRLFSARWYSTCRFALVGSRRNAVDKDESVAAI